MAYKTAKNKTESIIIIWFKASNDILPIWVALFKTSTKKRTNEMPQAAYNYCLKMHLSALILRILRT